jgi:myosin heavy subunit
MSEDFNNELGEKKPTAGLWILLTILSLLGAGLLGWMYSNESSAYSDCQTVNSQLESEMLEMNKALSGYIDETSSDLKQDFQRMLDTYDQLIEKDASLSDSLNEQKNRIQELMDELSDTKRRSFREISNLKKENSTLRSIMKDYLYRIDSLNTMNINLTSKLDETSSKLTKTETERNELQEQNEKNAELLSKGAQLNAFNFNTVALKYKLNGSTTEVTRAGRVDVISSSFTIGENKIAKIGNKVVYLQVTDPDGKVIYDKPNQVVNVGGREIMYTDKREINYQGQQLDMTIVHNLQGREVGKGNYNVKIFADGILIGKDSFTLK